MAVRQVPVAASRTGASAWRAGARKQPQSLRSDDGSQLPWFPDAGRGAAGVGSRRPPATALRLCPASSLQPAGMPVDSASSAHGPVPAPLATCPNPTAAPPALPCAGQAPPATPFSVAGPSEAPGLTLCFGLGPGPQRA